MLISDWVLLCVASAEVRLEVEGGEFATDEAVEDSEVCENMESIEDRMLDEIES